MTETPMAVVETPTKRKIHVRLPSRTTVRNGLALIGAFFLGGYAAKRKLDRSSACGTDTTEQPVVTDN